MEMLCKIILVFLFFDIFIYLDYKISYNFIIRGGIIMKGVIGLCLSKMMIEKFGQDKWHKALVKTGLSENTHFLATDDFDDSIVMKLINSVCEVLNISLNQAADAFGDYWVNCFAPEIYSAYYTNIKSAKDFLLNMDKVHMLTTKKIPNARPPRFEYEWKDDKTLIMKYKSSRKLIDFMIGLVKGVANYFKENIQITKLSNDMIQLVFLGRK
jgi:hypothetical protein